MPKYEVRVEAIGHIRVYDYIYVDAPSPAHARQMAVQHAEREANWDEMPSAADTFSDVTAVAVTLDQDLRPLPPSSSTSVTGLPAALSDQHIRRRHE